MLLSVEWGINLKKMKRNSILVKTLLYIVTFSCTILFILWFFQKVFLGYFYERFQIKKIDTLVSNILSDYNVDTLEELSVENSVCIQVLSSDGNYIYNSMYKGCLLNNSNNIVNTYKRIMYNSDKTIYKFKLINPKYKNKSILYGVRIDNDNYIYINTTLENLDSTTKILEQQLIYLVYILMSFSIIISYFISKKITSPIIDITNDAKKMANGNFDVTFKSSGTSEIDDLAETLNYAKNELKKTDELRRDLMANVSHDLKTPLTMIKAYAEKVRDLSYKNKDKMDEDLNIIIDETERLNILVNDILVLSKMQSTEEELEISEFDLVLIVKEIINHYKIIKETLNYKFILDIPDTCIIKADKKKITQVIYNFINNAINYTGDDNTVFITIKKQKKSYYVSVKDTGKGISSEDIKQIWNRYYKNNKNHKRNVVGTGLGLSICKQILEKHNYKYGVKTKKGQGSEFYFIIK